MLRDHFSALRAFLFLLFLLPGVAPAMPAGEKSTSPEVAELLEKVLASQQETATIQGRFVQCKTMALFKDPERSTGRFCYRQPDLMRLDYENPSRVILLLEGDNLVTYYPELKEAERFDIRKQKKRVFDHLIGESGIGQLQKNFVITLGGADIDRPGEDAPGGETHRLHLVPRRRQLKKRIDFIDLWVRTDNHTPVQYFIREKSGDSTLFRLEQVKVNGEVPDGFFHIDFPKDVVVTVRTGKDDAEDE